MSYLATLFIVILFAICSNVQAEELINHKNFKIHILDSAPKGSDLNTTIKLLKLKIEDSLKRNPKLTVLNQTTEIWITNSNWTRSAIVTHVSRSWLEQNNMDTRMFNGIEIINLKSFNSAIQNTQPMMLLHEFAHAYLFNILGWENQELEKTYLNAMAKKLYDSVPYLKLTGPKYPAYAKNNMWEFFSELTEAFFGSNDYYPFNADQLQKYDPASYDFINRIWLN